MKMDVHVEAKLKEGALPIGERYREELQDCGTPATFRRAYQCYSGLRVVATLRSLNFGTRRIEQRVIYQD